MNNRRVIQTDSLKLPVAPLSPDEYLGGRDASEATEIPRWSTEDWKAVVLGDAVLALPDGTRWSLLEVHHVFVNDRDAEIDGSGLATSNWRYRCSECGQIDEHHRPVAG